MISSNKMYVTIFQITLKLGMCSNEPTGPLAWVALLENNGQSLFCCYKRMATNSSWQVNSVLLCLSPLSFCKKELVYLTDLTMILSSPCPPPPNQYNKVILSYQSFLLSEELSKVRKCVFFNYFRFVCIQSFHRDTCKCAF